MPPRGRGRAATDAAASSKTPNSAAASGKRLFVTVGTTSFDALLAALDRPKVVATLRGSGCSGRATDEKGRRLRLAFLVEGAERREILRGVNLSP